MTRGQQITRIVISTVVIAGALSLLFFTVAQQDAQFYKHVDEVMDHPSQWYGKKLQLHGFVDGEPLRQPDTLNYRFAIKHGGAEVPVAYSGVVPDTFKAGSEVVVTGLLGPDGFHAVDIQAKCPSKYQAGDAAAGSQ